MRKSSILIIILLLIAIIPMLGTHITVGPFQFKTVVGTSMDPGITSNDIILFMPIDHNELKVGDVISYNVARNGVTISVAHRITKIVEEGYITKGDNLKYDDYYVVSSEDINGAMQLRIPYIVALGKFTKTNLGFIIMIIIPALFIILYEIKKINRRGKGDE